ncbi:copper chaperone PCu(A)C [Stenotrophomonas mori]|uniref:Copper chaperone PCu(A)C n=1 Tax=Stenotrophomonas mori TaxID=2871096 RepID=A0ABT0SGZ7_9GAMM|nr:copper chaperone PCu(A)C [Stenotrophomonas mori]MCL7714343.1 copper chaperone PCu(A)C [Stenotrophomonas mori]
MITKPFACVLLSVAGLAAGPLMAQEGCVRFDDGWIRLPAMPHMAAGYGTLRNDCGSGVAVVAAGSDAFAEVTLHETTLDDGVSRMREITRLPLAAGQAAELKPGGLHLMLMHGKAPLQEGQRVPIRLSLADGTRVDGELQVRRP